MKAIILITFSLLSIGCTSIARESNMLCLRNLTAEDNVNLHAENLKNYKNNFQMCIKELVNFDINELITLVAVRNYRGVAVDLYKRNTLKKFEYALKKCRLSNENDVFSWTMGLMPESLLEVEGKNVDSQIFSWRESIKDCVEKDLKQLNIELEKSLTDELTKKLVATRNFQFNEIEGCEKQAAALATNNHKIAYQAYELCTGINKKSGAKQ